MVIFCCIWVIDHGMGAQEVFILSFVLEGGKVVLGKEVLPSSSGSW